MVGFLKKKWVAWVLLFLFPPAGIALLWWNKHHGKITRIILTSVFSLLFIAWWIGTVEQKEAAQKLIDEGKALLEQGKYVEAIAKYEAAEYEDSSIDSESLIAEAEQKKQKQEQQEKYEELIIQAKTAIDNNDFTKARELILAASEIQNTDEIKRLSEQLQIKATSYYVDNQKKILSETIKVDELEDLRTTLKELPSSDELNKFIAQVELKLADLLYQEAEQKFQEKNLALARLRSEEALKYNKKHQKAGQLLTKIQAAEKQAEHQKAVDEMRIIERNSSGKGIAVTGIESLGSRTGYYSVSDNNFHFVAVGIYTENKGVRPVHVNPLNFTLIDPEGYQYNVDDSTYSLDNYLDAMDLQPNSKTQGFVIFIVPKKHKEFTLVCEDLFNEPIRKKIVLP